ncbi:hypothetical protein HZB07_06515 [Candidatus Saganbacteria bacterium]|nr:hypothetical protein [Candidatus Saganbacteria bacterium]
MMLFNFLPSFNRIFKKLHPQQQKVVFEAIEELKNFYDTRLISRGLGLKNLRQDYWEIRVSLQERILFLLKDNTVFFILIGNHDDIRRFLKSQ